MNQHTTVSANDRLGFTLFFSAAAIAVVILGVVFVAPPAPPPAPTLDVTLAQYQSDRRNDDADFLAQIDQDGSGDLDHRADVTTQTEADFADQQQQDVQTTPPAVLPTQGELTTVVITTRGASSQRAAPRPEKAAPPAPAPLPVGDQESLAALSREIASLQARLDAQQQAYARRPRVHTLTSVSARAHYEAAYIDQFRRAVEATGTQYFPARALAENTFGNVRLMVALTRDGRVKEVQILASSGHAFLDQAAVDSVQRAAPFTPFSGELRDKVDVLEIIRTWRFDARRILTSH